MRILPRTRKEHTARDCRYQIGERARTERLQETDLGIPTIPIECKTQYPQDITNSIPYRHETAPRAKRRQAHPHLDLSYHIRSSPTFPHQITGPLAQW